MGRLPPCSNLRAALREFSSNSDVHSRADSGPASPVSDSETAGAVAITPTAVHTGAVPGPRGSALRVLLEGRIVCFGITVRCAWVF